jgi:hypothetical protein
MLCRLPCPFCCISSDASCPQPSMEPRAEKQGDMVHELSSGTCESCTVQWTRPGGQRVLFQSGELSRSMPFSNTATHHSICLHVSTLFNLNPTPAHLTEPNCTDAGIAGSIQCSSQHSRLTNLLRPCLTNLLRPVTATCLTTHKSVPSFPGCAAQPARATSSATAPGAHSGAGNCN